MTVYLVGAGPGDPGLLTVRGADLLARADVVVYDRLSVASLLDLAPAHAELVNVGKAPGRVTLHQEAINELLVRHGRTGGVVVRLKGGDPFVFARGGEEAAALEAAGVPFEVVPGITSALAAPAYAGIPITLRHSSTSFTVVTGHEDPDKQTEGAGSRPGDARVDWRAVAQIGGTIVILMGVARWPAIAAELRAGGLPPDTPAAAVQWGTRPEQRTVRATLATLADHELRSPSVIVVGRVAAENLAWFERQPLFGRTVVITRARAQASGLVARLHALGARTVEVPAIEIVPPSDGGKALLEAVDRLAAGAYRWLVLTSPNGVERLFAHVPDTRVLGGVQVAAIGPGTAEALSRYRVVPDLVPERYVAEGLLEVFPAPPEGGGRVLLARAAVARDVLPDGLRACGWDVEVVEAYRTVAAPLDPAVLEAVAGADAVTFTSSSTVANYLAVAGEAPVPPVVVSIGPVTSATARDHGLSVGAEAAEHTIEGLVAALVGALAPHGRG